jgi:hypothetical protein
MIVSFIGIDSQLSIDLISKGFCGIHYKILYFVDFSYGYALFIVLVKVIYKMCNQLLFHLNFLKA